MKLDIQTALAYPFRAGNRKNCILWPGLVVLLGYVALGLVIAGWVMLFMSTVGPQFEQIKASDAQEPTFLIAVMEQMGGLMLLLFALIIPVMILTMAPLAGYIWQCIHHWQSAGFSAPSPGWSGRWGAYWRDGVKLGIYFTVWNIPLTLVGGLPFLALAAGSSNPEQMMILIQLSNLVSSVAQLVAFFLTPFIIAAVFRSAGTRTLGDLFDLVASIRLAKAHYGWSLLVMVLYVVLSIVYGIGFMILMVFTCGIGAAFLTPPMGLTIAHLFTQVFQPPSPQLSAESVPPPVA
jgi:hypothetical protein